MKSSLLDKLDSVIPVLFLCKNKTRTQFPKFHEKQFRELYVKKGLLLIFHQHSTSLTQFLFLLNL